MALDRFDIQFYRNERAAFTHVRRKEVKNFEEDLCNHYRCDGRRGVRFFRVPDAGSSEACRTICHDLDDDVDDDHDSDHDGASRPRAQVISMLWGVQKALRQFRRAFFMLSLLRVPASAADPDRGYLLFCGNNVCPGEDINRATESCESPCSVISILSGIGPKISG